jgi:hypothetical protein
MHTRVDRSGAGSVQRRRSADRAVQLASRVWLQIVTEGGMFGVEST